MAAEAEVKIKVGGYSRFVALRRSGNTAFENRKPPFLVGTLVLAQCLPVCDQAPWKAAAPHAILCHFLPISIHPSQELFLR